jgi:hypothetical protein
MKFKVGQVVIATDACAPINRGLTLVITDICPGWVPPYAKVEKPYYVRPLVGPVPFGTRLGKQVWYGMRGGFASEAQLRALPEEEAVDTVVATLETQP